MKYLKLVNIPLNLMNTSRYGGNGKSIPWEACGFNILMVRTKAVQFSDADGNFQQFLPITDEPRVKEILKLIKEDIADLDGMSAVIQDLEYSALVDLRTAAMPEDK